MSSSQKRRQGHKMHLAIVTALNLECMIGYHGKDCAVCADSLTFQYGSGGAGIECLAVEGFTPATRAGSPVWDAYLARHAPR